MTSFPSPPWHGDQVLPGLGSGSMRPPERHWVLGVPVSPTPTRCPPNPEAPEFPSLRAPGLSSPEVLQPAVGPTQPHYPGPQAAGDTATEWVRPCRQPRAPSLRPAPVACACPAIYPARHRWSRPRLLPRPAPPGPATWGRQLAASSYPG